MYRLFQYKALFLFAILLVLPSSPAVGYYIVDAQEDNDEGQDIPDVNVSIGGETPTVRDTNLGIEEVVAEGLEFPTTIAFLGPNDILVLEKEKGTVQRIVNGRILPEPLLDVNVATSQERCMCGVAVSKHIPGHTYVFLYYTEAESADAEDITEGKDPIGNHLYRYELVNNKLVNPKLLLDLPATPGPRHNGGAIMIGPDNNLYIPVGDVDGSHKEPEFETEAQNYPDGVEPDGRSGILSITLDGEPVPSGSGSSIIGDEYPSKSLLCLWYKK